MASLEEPSEPSTFVSSKCLAEGQRGMGVHGYPPRSGTFQPLRAHEGHATKERGEIGAQTLGIVRLTNSEVYV
jgi:hypothetical protein